MLVLDGSYGEGGGQVLRAALALAVACRRPVRLTRVRAHRPKPGLQPQHLTVVRALATVTDAAVEGAELGSTEIEFVPRALRSGPWRFDVGAIRGSAGSTSLVFQALLLPLSMASAPSTLTLIGGTHVPWSPPTHYLTTVFLPALRRCGIAADLVLRRWGWYPAGGGEVEVAIMPAPARRGFTAAPAAPVTGLSAVSRLPRSIAERQQRQAVARLAAAGVAADVAVEEVAGARNPGTFIQLAVEGRAGASALGRRGVPAERIADEAVDAFLAWRGTGADIDDHLADQLVPFLVLAREESHFSCPTVSSHLRTVAWVARHFVSASITLEDTTPARIHIVPSQPHG